MYRACAVDEFRILLSDRAPQTILPLRRAFPVLDQLEAISVVSCIGARPIAVPNLPPEAVRVIRESVIRDLEPDYVIVPAGFVDDGNVVICSIGALQCDFPTLMLWLPEDDCLFNGSVSTDMDMSTRVGARYIGSADTIYARSAVVETELKRAGALSNSVRVLPHGSECSSIAVAAKILEDCTKRTGLKRRPVVMPGDTGRMDKRPSLAFVSPMPPERTGVANYNARLLPALGRIYDIDVVTDQDVIDSPSAFDSVPIRSVGWFIDNFRRYDRVLYHMGNSQFHSHIPALIRDFPGTVAMHDVYLGELVSWLDLRPECQGLLQRSLLDGHGYGAARSLIKNAPIGEIARSFECNAQVLDDANGIIVHSTFAGELAARRFPCYMNVPVALAALCRPLAGDIDRAASRRRLGIGEDEFIVASFGFVNSIKLHCDLVEAWLASRMAMQGRGRLLIVGQSRDDRYLHALQEQIAASGHSSQIVITGYVEDAVMADYFSATDIAVQLRSESRGESSGAALDCLAFGLPLITNGCGSLGEIPDCASLKLPIDFNVSELTIAMESLECDSDRRDCLSHGARQYVAAHHDPDHVANLYARAIEDFARDGPRTRSLQTIDALARLDLHRDTHDARIGAVAKAVAANARRPGMRRLLVDVTHLIDRDLQTGADSAILQQLITFPADGIQVEAVRFVAGRFVLARQSMTRWLGLSEVGEDREFEPRNGDVFLGSSGRPYTFPVERRALAHYRNIGVQINFIINDFLSCRESNTNRLDVPRHYLDRLTATSAVADRLVCISSDVADELLMWLQQHGPERVLPLKIAHFPLGCDPLRGAGRHPDVTPTIGFDYSKSKPSLIDAIAGKWDYATWQSPESQTFDPLAPGNSACVVDFWRTHWPRQIASVRGVSDQESWGRWSDATMFPSVVVDFCKPLPRQGTISITARAIGDNCAKDTQLRIGNARYLLRFGTTVSTVHVDIATDGTAYAIELIPPAPSSPLEAGVSDDSRKLGLGLERLQVR